jgi:L-ribulose-5-phosphate 4-epimerase
MSIIDINHFREQLYEMARAVIRSGAISMSGHGNISLRLPGREEMLYTTAATLNDMPASSIARLRLDGTVLEGEVPPLAAAVISMHVAVYQKRPDTGCVLHTHSPFATAMAVAHQPLKPWTEAFGIFGLEEGVPVAAYGARGSAQAVNNIRAVISPRMKAVLLANHGVLLWEKTPMHAVQLGVIIEEAAQAALYAAAAGGPKLIPPELLQTSQDRAKQFESAGTIKG